MRHTSAALERFQRSLAIMEQVLGPDHANVGTLVNNMAAVAKRAGNLSEAQRLYARALAITETAVGADHPDVARTVLNLAGVHQKVGELEDALRLDQQALDILSRRRGPGHADVALAQGTWVRFLPRWVVRTTRAVPFSRPSPSTRLG